MSRHCSGRRRQPPRWWSQHRRTSATNKEHDMRIALRRALTTVTAASIVGGGLFVASPVALAASACSSDCINVSDISATPEGAVFTFGTAALSRVKVVITDFN